MRWLHQAERQNGNFLRAPVKKNIDGPVYLTGPNRYPNVIPEENFLIETALDKSKWILNAGPDKAEETLDDYIKILQRAKSLIFPCCAQIPIKWYCMVIQHTYVPVI